MKKPLLFATSLVVALAVLVGGCTTPHRTSAPVPAVMPGTTFSDLQGIFFAQFPSASRLVNSDSILPRTAQEFNDLAGANATARNDFERWCQLKSGVFYSAPGRTDAPTDVQAAVKTGTSMFIVGSRQYMSVADPAVCSVAGQPYLLFSTRAAVVNMPSSATFRAIVWVSPEDLAAFGPRALQAQEDGRQRAVDERAKEREATDAARHLADSRRSALLEGSAKGTQIVCDSRQRSGQTISELDYNCAGVYVHFSDFSNNGWRIASQSLLPEPDAIGIVGYRVTLILDKIR